MRRLTYLAAAAAAAASLALVPLAAASTPAAASTTAASPVVAGIASTGTSDWAGYASTMKTPGGDKGYDRFKGIEATFTVPGVDCAKSVIGPNEAPLSYRKTHGNDWSAAAFWVGLDGTGSKTELASLEQAGITAVCSGPKAYATYDAWYQSDPSTNHIEPMRDAAGHPGTVRVGDVISVMVEDNGGLDAHGEPGVNFGTPSYQGYVYGMTVKDVTRSLSWSSQDIRPDDHMRAPDGTAEVITEAVNNGPFIPKVKGNDRAIGLADFTRPVSYSAYQESLPKGWIYGLSLAADPSVWTTAAQNMGHYETTKIDGKPFTWWSTIIAPSALGGPFGGPSTFTTTFK